jgi:hypothetical protein
MVSHDRGVNSVIFRSSSIVGTLILVSLKRNLRLTHSLVHRHLDFYALLRMLRNPLALHCTGHYSRWSGDFEKTTQNHRGLALEIVVEVSDCRNRGRS